MKTACISFIGGCPRSKADTSLIFEYFRQNGWKLTNDFRRADFIIAAGCAFSSFAEERTLKFLSMIMKKRQKNVPVALFGCAAGIIGNNIADQYGVVPLTRKQLNKLDTLTDAGISICDIKEVNPVEKYVAHASSSFTWLERLIVKSQLLRHFMLKGLVRAYAGYGIKETDSQEGKIFTIRIARGCMEECTYCAIKNATGDLCSKPMETIIREFQAGLSEGYKIFSLVAEDVGAYGQDIGANIGLLLESILKNEGDYKLMWTDFHPRWLVKHFFELANALRSYPGHVVSMGFPVQSGSQRVLSMMKRQYDIQEVGRCILKLREICPDASISTHVLIGFPGETEAEFKETVKFIKAVGFDRVEVYDYSERPNTQAVAFEDKVAGIIKYGRLFHFCRHFRKTAIAY